MYLGDDYFDVDFIVDSRLGNDNVREYLIRWVGYGAADDSWLTIQEMNASLTRETVEWIRTNLDTDETDTENEQSDDDTEDDGVDDGVDGDIDDEQDEMRDEVEDATGAEEEAVPAAPPPAAGNPRVSAQTGAREERLKARQARMDRNEQ